MRSNSHPVRFLAVLAVGLLAACGSDSTGSSDKDENIGGVYNVATVAVPLANGTTASRAAPATLFEGVGTAGGQRYNIRQELLSASLSLVDTGSRYTYTATFRLTEVDGRLPPSTETVTESGNFLYFDGDISFIESLNSEIHIAPSGTLRNGVITVDIEDPDFNREFTATFRR